MERTASPRLSRGDYSLGGEGRFSGCEAVPRLSTSPQPNARATGVLLSRVFSRRLGLSIMLCKATLNQSTAPHRGMPIASHLSPNLTPLQKWTGSRFLEVSLKSIGLKVQLNHASVHCERPLPSHAALLVIHTNRIHEVDIQYCGCPHAILPHIQLLHHGFYPASQNPSKPAPHSPFSTSFTSLHLRAKVPHTTFIMLSRNSQITPALRSPNYATRDFSA